MQNDQIDWLIRGSNPEPLSKLPRSTLVLQVPGSNPVKIKSLKCPFVPTVHCHLIYHKKLKWDIFRVFTHCDMRQKNTWLQAFEIDFFSCFCDALFLKFYKCNCCVIFNLRLEWIFFLRFADWSFIRICNDGENIHFARQTFTCAMPIQKQLLEQIPSTLF